MRTSSMNPWKCWPKLWSPPMLTGDVGDLDGRGLRLARHEDPVHVEADALPIVRRGEMAPRVDGQREGAVRRPSAKLPPAAGRAARRVGLEVVHVAILEDHVLPPRRRARRAHPRRERHGRCQVEARRALDHHPVAAAVEGEGGAEPALCRPPRAVDGSVVVVAGFIVQRAAGRFVEAVCGHQPVDGDAGAGGPRRASPPMTSTAELGAPRRAPPVGLLSCRLTVLVEPSRLL